MEQREISQPTWDSGLSRITWDPCLPQFLPMASVRTWPACLPAWGLCTDVSVDRVCALLSCCGLMTMTHKPVIRLCWVQETCLSGWVVWLWKELAASANTLYGTPWQPAPAFPCTEWVVQPPAREQIHLEYLFLPGMGITMRKVQS